MNDCQFLLDVIENIKNKPLLSEEFNRKPIEFRVGYLIRKIEYIIQDKSSEDNILKLLSDIRIQYGDYKHVDVSYRLGIYIIKNFKKDLKKTIFGNSDSKTDTCKFQLTVIDTRIFFSVFNNVTNTDHVRNVRLLKCFGYDIKTTSDILEIPKQKVKKILKEIYGKYSS